MWKIQNVITDAVQVSFIIFLMYQPFFITLSQFYLLSLAKLVLLFFFPEKSYLGTQGLTQPLVGVSGLQVGYIGPLDDSLHYCLVGALCQELFIFQHIPGHSLIIWAWEKSE